MLELVICREGSWEGDECEVRESKGKLEPMKMDQILCWSLDCFQFQWCGYHAEEVGTLHQVTKYSSGPVVTEPWGSRERRNNWRPTPAPCQNDQSVDKQQHVWTATTCMNCSNMYELQQHLVPLHQSSKHKSTLAAILFPPPKSHTKWLATLANSQLCREGNSRTRNSSLAKLTQYYSTTNATHKVTKPKES